MRCKQEKQHPFQLTFTVTFVGAAGASVKLIPVTFALLMVTLAGELNTNPVSEGVTVYEPFANPVNV